MFDFQNSNIPGVLTEEKRRTLSTHDAVDQAFQNQQREDKERRLDKSRKDAGKHQNKNRNEKKIEIRSNNKKMQFEKIIIVKRISKMIRMINWH